MARAADNVSAFEPTAGPMLFATSLAPIFIAIYAPHTPAAMTNGAYASLPFDADAMRKTTTRKRKANPVFARKMPAAPGRRLYITKFSEVFRKRFFIHSAAE